MDKAVKVIEIYGANQAVVTNKTWVTARGIVTNGTKLLISHEENVDCYSVPGGGVEAEESPEECCVREIAEETGYTVHPVRLFLIVKEYYGEYLFVHHYYDCEIVGQTAPRLTPSEKERGLVPKWMEMEEVLSIFSRHNDWAPVNEARRGMYLREWTALQHYAKQSE